MENEKKFRINNRRGEPQSVFITYSLGRILMREEVDEIVGKYGSKAKRSPGNTSIDIEPPIPKQNLKELGEALKELAMKLDPTDPEPTYEIT